MLDRPDDPRLAFILDLARALHRYGIPAHRLEGALAQLAARVGLEGRFYSTPTAIIASFGPAAALRTAMIRVEPGEVDLARLSALDELSGEVARGTRGCEDGSRRLEEILAAPTPYGRPLTVLAFAIASGSAARLLGGGLREVLVGAAISAAIGLLAVTSGRTPFVARLLEGVGAFVGAALAVLFARLLGPFDVQLAIIGGLIVLLPGLTLVIALTELATRNLMSGTARLMSAMLVFLEIGFGVALGTELGGAPPVAPAPAGPALPAWSLVPALVLGTAAFAVLFRARLRDTGWIVAAGCLGFAGARVGSHYLGAQLGAFVGALALGIGSNVLGRALDKPGVITILPGMLLLVPGSVGYRGVDALLGRNVLSGVETIFHMAMVAVAIVTGFLLANALVPPRKVL